MIRQEFVLVVSSIALGQALRFDIGRDGMVVQKKRGREDGKRLNTDLRGLTAGRQLALRGVGKRFDSPLTTKLVHNPAFSRDLLPAVGVELLCPVVSGLFNQKYYVVAFPPATRVNLRFCTILSFLQGAFLRQLKLICVVGLSSLNRTIPIRDMQPLYKWPSLIQSNFM
jgi:hypothetical protein